MGVLTSLIQWYAAQCNGEWEHRYGISIESCDNPGWWVKIDLAGTSLEGRDFARVSENVDENGFQLGDRWLDCRLNEGVWDGGGDETKLARILTIFLGWAESRGG
jgi:hypothetical protein